MTVEDYRAMRRRLAEHPANAAAEVAEALKNPAFRQKVLEQMRTALPGMANSPDPLIRNRSIEVARLIRWLEKGA